MYSVIIEIIADIFIAALRAAAGRYMLSLAGKALRWLFRITEDEVKQYRTYRDIVRRTNSVRGR